MSSFERYYQDLLEWEGVEPVALVAAWNDDDVKAIADDISQAVHASNVSSQNIPIRPGSTNQSIGNQVEEFLIGRVNRHLARFEIIPCSGHGYPDREIREKATRRRFPLELKATSQWNPKDSNRRVLTSSSKKLRENFVAPTNHLLVTVCYEILSPDYQISEVRLDFIQPTTEVSVRLEASENHKILSNGSHPSRVIRGNGTKSHGGLI